MSQNSSSRFLLCISRLFGLIAALGAAGLLALTWITSSWLIEAPRRPLEKRHHDLLANPGEFGLDIVKKRIVTSDNIELECLVATRCLDPGTATKTREMLRRLKRHGVTESPENSRGTVYLLHGRGGRKEDLLWVAKRLVAADLRCVLYDARAHGQSGGKHCTYGKKETQDLREVIEHFEDLRRPLETQRPIFVFGNSLGAAVVLQALERERRITAAVAVAPFADLPEVVSRAARNRLHAAFPEALIHASLAMGGIRSGFNLYSISPAHACADSTTPLLLVHGEIDRVIPIDHSRTIQKGRSALATTRLVEISGASHSNALSMGGDDLYESIILFYLSAIEGERGTFTERLEQRGGALSSLSAP